MTIDNKYDFLELAADDLELSQYKFLAMLKLYSGQIRKNKLYPSLEILIEISRKILILMDMNDQFNEDYDENVDYRQTNNLIHQQNYSVKNLDYYRIQNLLNFSQWALPKIVEHIEEGKVLYDFVDKNIHITKQKSTLLHKNYGYFVIEDHSASLLHLYRFNSNEKTISDIQFRNLSTNFINVWSLDQDTKEYSFIEKTECSQFRNLYNTFGY